MRAVVISRYGGPETLEVRELPDPGVFDDGVLIGVAAAGINSADTQQRQGTYSSPAGPIPVPGLEVSGTVLAVGNAVQRWKPGDQVCALLKENGYAEKVVALAGHVLPKPDGVSLIEAASFPEVACTVWSTVFMTCHLSAGESFLVHGGTSGIGTFAIQIAKYYGAKVFVTAGSQEKLDFCKKLGADVCINYKTEDFVARAKEETGGKGVDVILDNMGASYLQKNLDSLNIGGRIFQIGTQGGTVTEIDLTVMHLRRLTLHAGRLRTRTPENKAEIVREVEKNVWPAIAEGKVKPVVYKTFPLSEASKAHELVESSAHIGKVLLIP